MQISQSLLKKLIQPDEGTQSSMCQRLWVVKTGVWSMVTTNCQCPKNAEHSIRSSSAMGGRAKKLAGVRETSYSIFACQEGLPSTSSSSAAAASASPSWSPWLQSWSASKSSSSCQTLLCSSYIFASYWHKVMIVWFEKSYTAKKFNQDFVDLARMKYVQLCMQSIWSMWI